jgi:hypothetical protein
MKAHADRLPTAFCLVLELIVTPVKLGYMNPSNIPFDFSFVFAWRKCYTVPELRLAPQSYVSSVRHDGMDILLRNNSRVSLRCLSRSRGRLTSLRPIC